MSKYKVLSIDAWADGDDGWTWNNWYTEGHVDTIPDDHDDIIHLLIDKGYLSKSAFGLVEVIDDQYNMVIIDKKTLEPLVAIEYGSVGDEQ